MQAVQQPHFWDFLSPSLIHCSPKFTFIEFCIYFTVSPALLISVNSVHIAIEWGTPLAHATVEQRRMKIPLHVHFECLMHIQMEFPSKQRCQQDDWNVLKGLVQRMTREDNFQESEDINLQIQ